MHGRKVIFWFHLTAAAVAGLVILILCFSGAILVFARETLDWSERSVRHPGPAPASAAELSLDDALLRAELAQPKLQIISATISPTPGDAIVLATSGKYRTWFLNPYSGDMQQESEPPLQPFFQAMGGLHTHLNVGFGQPIAAAADVVLLLLALSGLCLWWPRAWKRENLRPSIWFVAGARGRAREWNWHNVVAIWFLPVLVVLAGTGVVLSYRSVNAEMLSVAAKLFDPGIDAPRRVSNPILQSRAHSDSRPSVEEFAGAIRAAIPSWRTIELDFKPPLGPVGANKFGKPDQGVYALVTAGHEWHPFDSTLVTLEPTSGTLLLHDTYASAIPGRRVRMWVRLLHSGDALGTPGRIVACLACLAACLLVYTGYAMALRRLFGRIQAR